MLDATGGAGTRTLKFRGGMGLLGVIGAGAAGDDGAERVEDVAGA